MDGSDQARAVLPYLETLVPPAKKSRLVFCVTLGFSAPPDGFIATQVPYLWSTAEEHLEPIVREYRKKGYSANSSVTSRGRTWDDILRTAKQERVDLIAFATHGRRGWRRLIRGSVTEKVLRRSRIPLFVVRSPKPGSAEGALWKIRRLLVPFDRKGTTTHLLPLLRRMCERYRPEVTALRIVSPTRKRPLEGEEMREFEKLLEAVGETGNGVITQVRTGRRADQIRRASGRSDLVLMGSAGRTGLSRLLLGSVTESVVRRTEAPMLIAPAN